MSKYRNSVFHDYQSLFLVIFSSNYRHRLVLKIPFADHIFSKISKYRIENLHSRPPANSSPHPLEHYGVNRQTSNKWFASYRGNGN